MPSTRRVPRDTEQVKSSCQIQALFPVLSSMTKTSLSKPERDLLLRALDSRIREMDLQLERLTDDDEWRGLWEREKAEARALKNVLEE